MGLGDNDIIRCGVLFINGLNIWTQEKQLNETAWFNEKDSRFGLSSVKLIKLRSGQKKIIIIL